MTRKHLILILTILILIVVRCEKETKPLNEGKIIYKIKYLDSEKEKPIIALLPNEVEMKFKNNNTKIEIVGYLHSFKLIFINNFDKGETYTLLKFMGKQYACKQDSSAPPFGYRNMNTIKVIYTDSTENIEGYHCKIAKAYWPELQKDTITICYTNDIKIDKPNNNNPFKQINGVLMSFTVDLAGIKMSFKAKKIVNEKIKDSEFIVPNDYNIISDQELEEILSSFTGEKNM